MRQDDLELWEFVQRAGADEFARQNGMGERVVETGVGWPSSKQVRVQVVKENWISQCLDSSEEGRKLRLEQVVAIVNRIRQMNGAQARLSGGAVQFRQGQARVADGQLDRGKKAIGKRSVGLDAGVIDD